MSSAPGLRDRATHPCSIFRERPSLTWTFLVVWTISIVSGEALFVWVDNRSGRPAPFPGAVRTMLGSD